MGDPRVHGIPALLREARDRAGLTQSQLAASTAIAQPNISAYERGARSPTVRTLVTLLDACGAELVLAPGPSGQRP